MKKVLLYLGLLTILVTVFLAHNHSIKAYQPTSRGIGLIIIGAAIAISSTIFQGYYQNQFADPGLMGISSISTLFATFSILLGFNLGSIPGIIFAILGAFIGFYIFDWARNKFLITGFLLSASIASATILFNLRKHPDGIFWAFGSFSELNKVHVRLFAPFIEIGIITSFFIARRVGSKSNLTKFFIALGSAFLIGPFTNVTGAIIGFGLIAPAATRRIITGDTRRILSYATLVGPIILLLLDILINHVNEIAVSIVLLPIGILLTRFSKEKTKS